MKLGMPMKKKHKKTFFLYKKNWHMAKWAE
nr:ATP synthase F1 subunit 8 [Megalurothrips usitatus]